MGVAGRISVMSLALAVTWLIASSQAQATFAPPVRIARGDVLSVTVFGVSDPTMFSVMPDGSISGVPFGRVMVAGLTVEESVKRLTTASEKVVRKPLVFVTIVTQKEQSIFIVGNKSVAGRVPWKPNLDLRSVVSAPEVAERIDQLVVRVFRDGELQGEVTLKNLLEGTPQAFNPRLEPDDVVTMAPMALARLWMVDRFARNGELLVPEGSNLAQAIASAGGAVLTQPPTLEPSDPSFYQDAEVVVRRGTVANRIKLSNVDALTAFTVAAGDTITVQLPATMKVTVMGEVIAPGERVWREGTDLTRALAAAQGAGPQGTLEGVMVLRGSEVVTLNMADRLAGRPSPDFALKDGDIVVVPRNERSIYILGEVRQPGRLLLKDEEELNIVDALAKSGGLISGGSLRRVMLARRGPDGKHKVEEFFLDRFLKDGDLTQNPRLQPGDFIYFGQSRGFNGREFLGLLPSLILLDSVSRR